LAKSDYLNLKEGEKGKMMQVRFRTIGDMTCTGAVLSTASTIDEIVAEVAASRFTERGTRADDKRSETAMEDRKKVGYF
jgi:sulfate adenylyltransferase subunit 2